MSKLNKNSSAYIFSFALGIILVCGVLLSVVAGALFEKQQLEKELERKRFILKSALGGEQVDKMEKPAIADLYDQIVSEKIVNQDGVVKNGMTIKDVVVAKEYKKLDKKGNLKADEIFLPVYVVKDQTDTTKIASYVMPTYGYGLWDNIWAFLALQSDFKTIQGVVLDHKGETPGLGARITEDEVMNRYKDKSVYENDKLVSVTMMKGEGNDYSDDPNKVDGLSGATLTANGINDMFSRYLDLYQPYIKNTKANN